MSAAKAVDECGIIQVMTNKFNAENDIGAKVVTQTVDWGTYYDLLSATYSTGNIPDVAVMHGSTLPSFAARDLVEPVGEDLAAAGVQNALADPTLTIFNAQSQPIATNDNWRADASAGAVQSAHLAPPDDRDAAIAITLAPGAYTAIVRGAGGATGIALVEVYDLD